MAAIEVTEKYPRVRIETRDDHHQVESNMALDECREAVSKWNRVSIYVDGWTEPWRMFVDSCGHLRARCPTAPNVVPLVVTVTRDGAQLVDEDGVVPAP
jgi:hypothetical protein